MTAAGLLGELHNLSASSSDGRRRRRDDIAALLDIPGLDASGLWQRTAHHRRTIIKEVSNMLFLCTCDRAVRAH